MIYHPPVAVHFKKHLKLKSTDTSPATMVEKFGYDSVQAGAIYKAPS